MTTSTDHHVHLLAIVNATPDSFSDGGRWQSLDGLCRQTDRWYQQGIRWLDVGAESTRPGAQTITPEVEWQRLEPVLSALKATLPNDVTLSIDTRKAWVADKALAMGAHWINDVSGLTYDTDMLATVVNYGAGLIIMHSQGTPDSMQHNPTYTDVLNEVSHFLLTQRNKAIAAGVKADCIMVDPGFGFGKTVAHNVCLLNNLGILQQMMDNTPVVVGLSRKSFLTLEVDIPPQARDSLTQVGHTLAWQQGIRWFRVHDPINAQQTLALLTSVNKDISSKTT
jgi:dihydropteroate synthase